MTIRNRFGSIKRRSLAVGTLALVATIGLAACGSDDPEKADGTVGYQLSWSKDYEWAGSYIADTEGYWKEEGITVKLQAGGPDAVRPTQTLAAGKADIATDQIDHAATLMDSGGTDLAMIGALFQLNGLNILSRPDNPIRTPKDLEGKKIGVFSTNESAWSEFLKIAGVDRSKITEVPVQYDVTPLVNGEVDGYQGYAGGELVRVQEAGLKPVVLKLADNGYNPLAAGYIVRRESLNDPAKREELKKFLRGEILGWQKVVYGDGIPLGAKLAVDKYGKDLGLDLNAQEQSLRALLPYIHAEGQPLLTFSESSLKSSQQVLDAAGIDVKVSDIVDTSLLEEIYQGKDRI